MLASDQILLNDAYSLKKMANNKTDSHKRVHQITEQADRKTIFGVLDKNTGKDLRVTN